MKKYALIFIALIFLGNIAFADYFIEKRSAWKSYSRLFSYYFLKSSLLDSYMQTKIIIKIQGFEKDDADVKEYSRIFMLFREAPGKDQKKWRDFCLKMTERFKGFVKKYSKSPLADDAKLRIAEYYHAAGMKRKAKYWLEDIIKNHKTDNYCRVKLSESKIGSRRRYTYYFQEYNYIKTAAWALFYRGYWFGERKYLQRVLSEYSNCLDPANEARDVLREWKK